MAIFTKETGTNLGVGFKSSGQRKSMIEPHNKHASGLKVYDPRHENRCFQLADGNYWNSKGTKIVFFETDNYQCFSDAEWLSNLLTMLISFSEATKTAIKVSGYHDPEQPEWLKDAFVDDNTITGWIDNTHLSVLCKYYENKATFQVWNYYGLRHETFDREVLLSFPEVLMRTTNFCYLVEIDLDGILLGYLNPNISIDILKAFEGF
jgi:hypothetical protein